MPLTLEERNNDGKDIVTQTPDVWTELFMYLLIKVRLKVWRAPLYRAEPSQCRANKKPAFGQNGRQWYVRFSDGLSGRHRQLPFFEYLSKDARSSPNWHRSVSYFFGRGYWRDMYTWNMAFKVVKKRHWKFPKLQEGSPIFTNKSFISI